MRLPYPDRRDQLFGREPVIHALCDRARHAGLTVVAARALMGKTWTLIEAARRLEEEGRFIVGYHESKGTENSHLLYAVSNLYTRWLEDSRLRDQAASLWETHREGLLPRVGVAVGSIIEKLGGALLPGGVASLVQKGFEGLASLQKSLDTGGMELAPLAYDEARQLADLVVKLSGQRVVLILDAWEKSPSIGRESKMLESVVKAPEQWDRVHVFLAVRNPDVDLTKLNNEAWLRAKDIAAIANEIVLEMGGMDGADPHEAARLLQFVRARIPAAKDISDKALADMIDDYPGVLDFWLRQEARTAQRDATELLARARDAQALRYRELDHLLAGLKEPALSLAARLAVFPRVDAAAWAHFASILLAGNAREPFHELVDAKILADEPFATYGHDTRHVAARRWFLLHRKAMLRGTLEAIVDELAAAIEDVDARSRPFFEALAGCADAAQDVTLDAAHACLIAAAHAAFGDEARLFTPGFREACAAACERRPEVGVLVGLALMSRAVENERRGEPREAIADYDRLVDLPSTSPREQMKALTNRGIMKRRLGIDAGLEDCNRAIALAGVPDALRVLALFHRATILGESGDKPGEIADYTRVIATEGCSPEEVASALFNRAITKREIGDEQGADADLETLIALPDAPPIPLGKALRNRAIQRANAGDGSAALADYTRLLKLDGVHVDDVAIAAYNSAAIRCEAGDWEAGIRDYTRVVELPGAAPDMVAKALVHRATAHSETGDVRAVLADLTAAAAVAGVSEDVASLTQSRLDIVRGAWERSGRLGELNPAPDTP